MEPLNVIWFVIIGFLFTGYAVLDGFDLGIGILHLFHRDKADRDLALQAIAPVWDGNEVWLVAAGGALFAAFPPVYATVLSGFYLGVFLFLTGLILRGAALEFRHHGETPRWRKFWDTVFALGSFIASFVLGLVAGNLIRGIPLNGNGEYTGGLPGLFNPCGLLFGITAAALFAAHGAFYLGLKMGEDKRENVLRLLRPALPVFLFLFTALLFLMTFRVPYFIQASLDKPVIIPLPLAVAVAVVYAWRELVKRRRPLRAFLGSCAAVVIFMLFLGALLFPFMVYSHPFPANSLSALRHASSPHTLKIMLIIAALGMPPVLASQYLIHRLFRGPVKKDVLQY